jgi:uncharacterized protein VirK/YbjX
MLAILVAKEHSQKPTEQFMIEKQNKLSCSKEGKWALTLKHRTEVPIRLNSFTGTAVLGGGFAMTKCKADEETLAHLIFPISHAL